MHRDVAPPHIVRFRSTCALYNHAPHAPCHRARWRCGAIAHPTELSNCRTVGLSNCRTVGLSKCREGACAWQVDAGACRASALSSLSSHPVTAYTRTPCWCNIQMLDTRHETRAQRAPVMAHAESSIVDGLYRASHCCQKLLRSPVPRSTTPPYCMTMTGPGRRGRSHAHAQGVVEIRCVCVALSIRLWLLIPLGLIPWILHLRNNLRPYCMP